METLEYQTMSNKITGEKFIKQAYGFDEISIVPGDITIDPELCDVSWNLGDYHFKNPLIASAMDSVVSVESARKISALGSLPVLNLEGLNTRYENPQEIIEKIVQSNKNAFVSLMQELYAKPILPELVEKRVWELKENAEIIAVSVTPYKAEEYGRIAINAGCHVIVVQATVTSIDHISNATNQSLNIENFCKSVQIPVIVGNCVTYKVAKMLMEAGASGVLIGIGPGAACTSRKVLGVGVPMATALAECSAAREDYLKSHGRYVPVIGDGGMAVGGDICKALACGADAVMIGSPLAKAKEAPGKGYHWGMATPNAVLPRGTRIHVGTTGTLQEIIQGPAQSDNGSQNLVGAIKTCMGIVGAKNIREMHDVQLIVSGSFQTEGKAYQLAQGLG